mgnify:CR=1 FL=1
MKRDYKEGIKSTPIFFTGTEVEHTPAFGLHTLFVVDIQDPEEVVEYARGYGVQHVYLGANHSFDGSGQYQYQRMINKILQEPLWCTLEMTNDVYKEVHAWVNKFNQHNFIPNIRVELPRLMNMNYNATIKIGDVDYKATNPGVWCHKLNDLKQFDKFTNWSEYGKDQIIDEVEDE